MQGFLKEKLDVNCKVVQVKRSGKVFIVKLNSEEEKWEIMNRKNRLKGESIFIEKDLRNSSHVVGKKDSKEIKCMGEKEKD